MTGTNYEGMILIISVINQIKDRAGIVEDDGERSN